MLLLEILGILSIVLVIALVSTLCYVVFYAIRRHTRKAALQRAKEAEKAQRAAYPHAHAATMKRNRP